MLNIARYEQTYISETEIRYFCSGNRKIIQEQKDSNGNTINIIELILDSNDLENIISIMKQNNQPFSLQAFRTAQDEYIIFKYNLMQKSKSHRKVLKP